MMYAKFLRDLFYSDIYRDSLKGLYVVTRIFFLFMLIGSAWPCLGPA